MSVLTERVCRTIERYRLLPPGARVIAAVSGGADSTALVCLLSHLAGRLGVELAGLAHFNHALRGNASDADERFCQVLAGRLEIGFFPGRGDVRSAARQLGASIEDAGRRLRYRFLDEAAAQAGATHVAVGHTRDDQAETLLLNLCRGAGPRGLGSMRPQRGPIVRPLIECSHRDLVDWLAAEGIAFREDESNTDRRFSRNRLRHQVMPVMEAAFPGAGESLARSAEIARADADYLDELADEWLSSNTGSEADGGPVIDVRSLGELPLAIRRRVVFRALGAHAAGRFVGFGQVDRVLALAAGELRGRLLLPGQQATVEAGRLVLAKRLGRGGETKETLSSSGNSFRALLSIPGEVLLSGGLALSSNIRHGPLEPSELRRDAHPDTAFVDAALCRDLTVRFRRPGDRFRPLGLAGRKTLQDYFVDRKVPRAERARTPLVVDAGDRIVWVAGHAVSEDFRVSDATCAVVILKLRGERV
jgi:tRNA(Ile)-lysidine synthase